VGFSFLYGMLHSLGPGHGKVIVSTYLATHPTKVKASLVITVVSALFQAVVAITLVTVLVWGFSASMRMVNEKAMLFVSASFGLVALLGGLICYKAIKAIIRSLRTKKSPTIIFSSFAPANQGMRVGFQAQSSHVHHADSTCGCGHNHVAEADAINHASTWREYAAIIASIGIRPCTGAIMVLLFANVVGLYWMGVVSAVLMAIGTALTTSIIAVMTLTSKHLVQRYFTSGKQIGNSWQVAGAYLQLFGGILLVAIGLLLMSGENYGLSPMFSI
jgi:nickel/cobalt exporter